MNQAGKMGQQSTALAALAENHGLIPGTHIRWLTLLVTPASGEPMPSSGLGKPTHTCAHKHTHAHIHLNNSKSF